MTEDSAKTLDYLRRICSAREYCRRDILEKVKKRMAGKMDEEAARAQACEMVDELEKEGYLSEERYAGAFARDKAGIAGWGPLKIRQALQLKGVSKEAITNAMESIDAAKTDDRLRKSLETKYKLLRDDPQVKIKLLKFALSRGFEYPQAVSAVNEILKG